MQVYVLRELILLKHQSLQIHLEIQCRYVPICTYKLSSDPKIDLQVKKSWVGNASFLKKNKVGGHVIKLNTHHM